MKHKDSLNMQSQKTPSGPKAWEQTLFGVSSIIGNCKRGKNRIIEEKSHSVHTGNGKKEFLFLKGELEHNLLQGAFHN